MALVRPARAVPGTDPAPAAPGTSPGQDAPVPVAGFEGCLTPPAHPLPRPSAW